MESIISQNIEIHKKLLSEFELYSPVMLTRIATLIIEALRNGRSLYLCGNGGSAADAQHVAGEFVGRFRRERRALPAVALSTDTSVMTCIGNDYSFDDIFRRQVEALLKPGDLLWVFSTSGNSSNILAAMVAARSAGAKIISFTGKEKSEVEQLSDECLCVRTSVVSSAQELHQLAYHIICDLVDHTDL
jgi:D-sedoheptulose 7-phosphate isomerase